MRRRFVLWMLRWADGPVYVMPAEHRTALCRWAGIDRSQFEAQS